MSSRGGRERQRSRRLERTPSSETVPRDQRGTAGHILAVACGSARVPPALRAQSGRRARVAARVERRRAGGLWSFERVRHHASNSVSGGGLQKRVTKTITSERPVRRGAGHRIVSNAQDRSFLNHHFRVIIVQRSAPQATWSGRFENATLLPGAQGLEKKTSAPVHNQLEVYASKSFV